jgi:hypothetical protein
MSIVDYVSMWTQSRSVALATNITSWFTKMRHRTPGPGTAVAELLTILNVNLATSGECP